jgi:hypothetical protein
MLVLELDKLVFIVNDLEANFAISSKDHYCYANLRIAVNKLKQCTKRNLLFPLQQRGARKKLTASQE